MTTEKNVEEIALAHLRGIEGGLTGAVRDARAGMAAREAAGLGGSWDLPTWTDAREVEAEVLRQLAAAVEADEMHDATYARPV